MLHAVNPRNLTYSEMVTNKKARRKGIYIYIYFLFNHLKHFYHGRDDKILVIKTFRTIMETISLFLVFSFNIIPTDR